MMSKTDKAQWIWYPGDFEIWLGNIFNNRRTERGAMFPPFWKQDSHYVTVEFSREFVLQEPETVSIACEGEFNIMLDGKLQYGMPDTFTVPAGSHKLNLKVWNQSTPPSLYICGPTIKTDSSWLSTYEDKIWIDENGVAHGSGVYVPAASWCFDRADTPPSAYALQRREQKASGTEQISASRTLYDFGRETFGYLKLKNLHGRLRVNYGESREEALDDAHCETLDLIDENHRQPESKAFRYVCVERLDGASYDDLLMDYEYAPHNEDRSGSFLCSDDELNRIWEVAAYTMDLTTREFFMDGIKRDRWTWSGDAIQSYLMNYYLRFDTECVKRTIRQLRGKDPVTAHVNTIMDYTFYWFKSIIDYYEHTADADFIREMWPRMKSLMDYVLSRVNAEGMADGKADDWIFVDWVDFPMHKRGTLCFEQILFCKALDTMAECAELLLAKTDSITCRTKGEPTLTAEALDLLGRRYRQLANELRQNIDKFFWDDTRKAYLHAIEDGRANRQITKFPNMFAVLYGIANDQQQADIIKHVMLNKDIDPITTPYMRFYELETLCMAGLQTQVLKEIRDYWGGMLRQGATSFWEKYVPTEQGTAHLAMYGRPYGKSLCHAWGASPVYLLGKYFLGVKPTKAGYAEYEVRPTLGSLQWIKGDVPTPMGLVHVEMDDNHVAVTSPGGRGILIMPDGRRMELKPNEELRVNVSPANL